MVPLHTTTRIYNVLRDTDKVFIDPQQLMLLVNAILDQTRLKSSENNRNAGSVGGLEEGGKTTDAFTNLVLLWLISSVKEFCNIDILEIYENNTEYKELLTLVVENLVENILPNNHNHNHNEIDRDGIDLGFYLYQIVEIISNNNNNNVLYKLVVSKFQSKLSTIDKRTSFITNLFGLPNPFSNQDIYGENMSYHSANRY
ncbi:hypothetical protein AX774_g5681 [Zancudomyces culisetae]|uniref:Uncharacterized protein n=1 Tax=Zancudomyces culisetae TaxID=1213189 RepID=A0A1R1PIU7_ZANCU|nr:hypothetical protein AX774_g5681 [Zancudomyces culisetae]|eukprot:OMH80877.1 hypothetical protein AX774_g5681 [Zancudomyces culisetae]